MILVVDVGNTNTVLGVWDADKLVCSGRLSTNTGETDIEFSMKLRTFLDLNGVGQITGGVISSVVPALVRTIKRAVEMICGAELIVVGPGIKTGLNIKLDNPAEMGADLVAGDVAVINKYKLPAILFDIGTATTASVIDKTGAHLGGAIMCGVKTAINALSSGTAQLPQIDISAPSKVIGANTIDAMKCGSVIGTAALIEGMVMRFEEELGEKATVVITGGLGGSIAKELRIPVTVDDNLLLEGLRIIYEKNQKYSGGNILAVFRPFKAFRPAEKYQRLIPALPYDVMSSDEAREAVRSNPLSFLHVDRAEIDFPPGKSPYEKDVYEKAKENLLNLEKSGALVQDEKPCFYIYRQEMNGRVQTGIAGCASIDDYMNNVIKKHEKTLAKKEADRIRHVSVTNANTGPIFLTYRKNDEITRIINDFADKNRPVYNFEAAGALQTVWVIDDDEINSRLSELFGSVKAFYIADGHHRCESAVRVGQMKRYENSSYTGDEEFNFFLAVAFADSDLRIMDYNRVVKDLNGFSPAEFIGRISDSFEVKKQDKPYSPSEKHTFGMFLDGQWYSLKANEKIINDFNPVEALDVSVLQNNLLDPVLGIKDPKNDERIDFIGGIRGLSELEKRANTDMKLAFSMYPTTVGELMAIADAGEIMPPKSTWFEPKLLSGIFIHHLS